jgi:hypothetical protein
MAEKFGRLAYLTALARRPHASPHSLPRWFAVPYQGLQIFMIKPAFWWLGLFLLVVLLTLFLVFGIYLLMLSFDLKDPMIVVTLIFSSSLMVLVSISLIAGLVVKGMARLKKGK